MTELEKNKSVNYKIYSKGNGVYLFIIKGKISIDGEILSHRDGIGIWDTNEISIEAKENSQILLIEVPMS
jgi:redox-sensitive bicupin YhaK (pirin superfamily)